jgi:radical SAM protein with 4Fe4S-binding SPASM domain
MRKWNDERQILKAIGFNRLYNLLLLNISFLLCRIFRIPINFGKPFNLSIEPTTACNLACPECPSGLKQFTRPTGKIDLGLHEKILQQVHRHVFYINYYFQGEPFLHPQFLDLIRSAKKYRIYTSTSTNAHFIDEEKAKEIVSSGLDRLIISIDGLTQETYQNYRVNGQLAKVIEATKLLIQAKDQMRSSTPHLIFQFLVVKQNEHEVSAIFSLGKELGINEVRLKTAQLYEYKQGNELMPENESYSRYKQTKDKTYELKYKTGNHCWRMWSGSVITWDGVVVPCCFDKDAKHQMGNLLQIPFKEIWNSDAYQAFRRQLVKARNEIEICKNCSEGAKVWI